MWGGGRWGGEEAGAGCYVRATPPPLPQLNGYNGEVTDCELYGSYDVVSSQRGSCSDETWPNNCHGANYLYMGEGCARSVQRVAFHERPPPHPPLRSAQRDLQRRRRAQDEPVGAGTLQLEGPGLLG